MKAYSISGSKGTILQVWNEGKLIIDLDSVSDETSSEISEAMDKYNGQVDWQSEPFGSAFDSEEERAEYVGA